MFSQAILHPFKIFYLQTAVILFLILFTSSAYGQAVLDSASLSQSVVNVSPNGATVSVNLWLKNSPDSLIWVFVYLGDPDGETQGTGIGELVEGSKLDGKWTAQIYLLPSTPAGTYPVYIQTFDESFDVAKINTGKSIQVTGGDSEPPAIAGEVTVSPTTIDLSGGPGYDTVTVQLSDNFSGVGYVNIQFVKGEQGIASGYASLISGDQLNGVWKGVVQIPQNADGILQVIIYASDNAGNSANLTTGKSITVSGGDILPPVFIPPASISPAAVNVSGGDPAVTVTVTMQDDFTKVDNVYFDFMNSSEEYVAGNSADLVSGDSLNGQWSSEIIIPQDAAEGILNLKISAGDRAGNFLDTLTTYTLQVSRVPEALVTFQVDLRRLERLGIITHSGSASVEIFDGVNAGNYNLEDPNNDSIWTFQKIMIPGQTIKYAFAVQNNSSPVYELNGNAGGRTLNIPDPVPVVLPVVYFDNLTPENVDQTFAARVVEGFNEGNLYPYEFNSGSNETFTTVDFSTLNQPTIIAVRRFAKAPGGTLPSGIVTMAQNIFWAIDKAPAAVSFEGKLIFEYNLFGGISEPGSLRLLRRENRNQPWTVASTEVNPDDKTLSANIINNFSEWTIGSVSAANTLQQQVPGSISSPYPNDGESNVEKDREFSWSPSSAARRYDFYLWKTTDPVPAVPTAANLNEPKYQYYQGLLYNTTYNWKVVAKNIVGSVSSPVWSFSTQSISDLIVEEIILPPSGFSGKEFDVQWSVKNIGNSVTGSSSWTDAVYLSVDSLLDTRADTRFGLFENVNPLNPGETYINFKTAKLPEGVFGKYYIIVSANYYHNIPETNDTNNVLYKSFTVNLTPPPDLQVVSMQTPESAFSGQNIDVTYTVKNTGSNATQTAIWYDGIYISEDSVFNLQNSKRLAAPLRNEALLPDSFYVKTVNIKLPEGVSGKYFLFVAVDYRNDVFEYTLESNNMKQAAIQITLSPPPDLVVTSVFGPESGSSGKDIPVTWTVQNQGAGNVVGSWRDRIFVSTVTPFDSAQAIFVKELNRYHNLAVDSSYTENFDVTLPNGISGSYYIFVEADWKNQIFEYTFENNNTKGSLSTTQVNLSPWPDLIPTTVQIPDSAAASEVTTVSFSVKNQGAGGITSGQWTDSIYISSGSSWNPDNAEGIGSGFNSAPLSAEESYIKTLSGKIPRNLPGGTYYVYIKSDAQNQIYEHTDETNNILRSGALILKAYPPVDLAVDQLTIPASGSSGQPINFQFSVKNIGTGTTAGASWTDVVYLSTDTLLDTFDDIFFTRVQRNEPLQGGSSYTRNITANLPNGTSGNYYVIVKSDSSNMVEDINTVNNIKHSAARISVTLSPSADLQLVSASVPTNGQAGQPVALNWKVRNIGEGINASSGWNDGVFLSQNSTLNPSDISLISLGKNGPLNKNAEYDVVSEVTLPIYISGNYYIIIKSDSRDEVYEHNAESNNILAFPISVTLPPPSDLVVTNIITPPEAVAGKDVSVTWTIHNQGSNPAAGRMTEAVYFSRDTEWDVSDPLLGMILRDIDLAPGGSQTSSFKINPMKAAIADSTGDITANLPGLLTGEYHVIVRTNLKNNIRESDLTNNKKASDGKVSVDVISLPLSVSVADTIYRQDQNFYKVEVPAGMDLRITALGSSNIPSMDVYIAYGRIPSTSDYDFRSMDPVPVTREVFVPSTKAGTYFVTLRSNNYFADESYSILAEVLSFSVASVQLGKGGMGGLVTTTVSGAGFRDSVRVYLYKSGNKVTEGSVRKFKNTMELVVRWDLKNVPLGTYDVVAVNKDGSPANKLDAFQVEPAREMTVTIGQSTPNLLLYGRKETYTFMCTNTSNVDIAYAVMLLQLPLGTEADLTASPRFFTRSTLIPDSLKLEDGNHENFISTENSMMFPLVVRDLVPGEGVDCRITFRNQSYFAGTNFPMSVGVRSFDKNAYLALQMSTIESSRQSVLANQSSFSPEVVANAYNSEAFAKYMLEGYVALGLLDPEDVPPQSMIAALLEKNNMSDPFQSSQGISIGCGTSSTSDAVSECQAFFSKLGCVAAVIDCFIPFPPIPPPFNFIMCGFGIAASCGPWDAGLAGCIGVASGLTCLAQELICKRLVASLDPNDIIGPEGFGDKQWVALNATLGYQVRFENDPKKATAPAQRVVVTQQLDSTIDFRSFRLGSFGFANHTFDIQGSPSYYSARLDLRDSLGIYVDFIGGIDITTGKISWSFKSIDPSTGDMPNNPMTGLLPVNDSTGKGNGFIRYTVRPNPVSKTGDVINSKAKIIFDQNDPLDTPPVFNTVDAVSPVSKVRPLSSTTSSISFPVTWGGTDDPAGSGLKSYSVYVACNDSQYTTWKINTTDTTAVFSGIAGNRYKFFSLASDNAGNIEPVKLTEDASIQIISSAEELKNQIPTEYVLNQNYPNPFNPSTIIKFGIPEKSNVQLVIYDILGREVVTLINTEMEAGWYQREFNAGKYASGVYIYRLQAGNFTNVKKMILLK